MSDFDDLIRSIEEEAKAQGPEAVAELEALDRHFAALAADPEETAGPNRTFNDAAIDALIPSELREAYEARVAELVARTTLAQLEERARKAGLTEEEIIKRVGENAEGGR